MKNFKSHHITPLIKKNRFYNDGNDAPENFIFQTLPMFVWSLLHRKKRFPKEHLKEWSCPIIPEKTSQELRITWIGHASFLIQVNGLNILTDPIFKHASLFFPRVLPVGIEPQALPKIDAVILSHNHPDHTDIKSLKMIPGWRDVQYFVPHGDKAWLQRKGFASVHEFMWWQQQEIRIGDAGAQFTFLPAHHWSQRGLFDRNKSLWGSWMIQANHHHIYFAGDTAYSHHFQAIAKEFPKITTALMPIAPCDPDPWMRKTHMDADQAVQAFIDLQAQQFIPMHWGTFAFGRDHFHGPIDRLGRAWKNNQNYTEQKQLHLLKAGQQVLL